MVQLVHDSGWSREPSWPANVAEGDLAVVARRWTSVSGVGYPNPSPGPQWIGLGNYGTRTGATRWQAELFWWQVRGTSLPSIGPGSNFTSFRLLIVRGSAGIGRARTGRALVPVSENGGAVAIGVEASTAGDLTILPGSGSVSVGWGAASSDGVFGNPGWNHSHTRIYELLPPAGPLAPLVLAPGDGAEVSAAEPVEFEWQHRPSVAGGRQDAYQLRVWDDVSDPEYWNASTGAWTTSEATNSSSTQGVAVPAAAFTVNVPMSWQVRSREGVDGRWSAWSSAASFMPVTPPSVSVTAPGDLHDDLSPLVAWDAVTPRGEQTAFRVQIAQLGTILYDSGSQPGGDDEWQVPPQDWSNGALYQARVQVQQTGGSWSSWDTRDFTISWTEPEEPVVQARRHEHGIEVTVLDGEVAQARATLEAVLGEEPVYSPDAPADTSRAWYNAGEVRRWVDYGPGPVTNLVTNPRGRATSGTVTIRENRIPNPVPDGLAHWGNSAVNLENLGDGWTRGTTTGDGITTYFQTVPYDPTTVPLSGLDMVEVSMDVRVPSEGSPVRLDLVVFQYDSSGELGSDYRYFLHSRVPLQPGEETRLSGTFQPEVRDGGVGARVLLYIRDEEQN
ncbi:MAG TPA: hypothetical protein VK053_00065, partial [Jiangellaceae bacterium]|nr:hypothetical protein [Jiangellaceae bacterium]